MFPGLQLREGEDGGIFFDAYSRLLSREIEQSAWTQKTLSFFALWRSVTMESVEKESHDKPSTEMCHRSCTHAYGDGHRTKKPERKNEESTTSC